MSAPRGTSNHEGNTAGYAGGWSVWRSGDVWHWSAYGPNGGTHSSAPSEAEAVRRAWNEKRNLEHRVGS